MRMIKTLLTIGIGILFLQGCAVNPSLQVLEKTKTAGGHIKLGKTTIPAMGWYAVISDLDGNSIGLYQKS